MNKYGIIIGCLIALVTVALVSIEAHHEINRTWNHSVIVCSECANISNNIWFCEPCFYIHYNNTTDYIFGLEDVCLAAKIKWKSFGWVMGFNTTCTNFPHNYSRVLNKSNETWNCEKIVCKNCTNSTLTNNLWNCSSCICPYWNNTENKYKFYFDDECNVTKIKWKPWGWIMGFNANCTNLYQYTNIQNYGVGNISVLNLSKCICPECANVSEFINEAGYNIWVCDTCICPHYVNHTGRFDWYLFKEDICITNKIKWKSFGWNLAVHNQCTNFDLTGNCTNITTNGITSVICEDLV